MRVMPGYRRSRPGISLGMGSRMVLSAAPVMVQLASTSHRARPWESSSSARPSLVLGSSSPYRAAMTGQKRFYAFHKDMIDSVMDSLNEEEAAVLTKSLNKLEDFFGQWK